MLYVLHEQTLPFHHRTSSILHKRLADWWPSMDSEEKTTHPDFQESARAQMH